MKNEEIDRRFQTHKPSYMDTSKMQDIRSQCRSTAELIEVAVPDGREKALALTKLEESMFWANAGIARASKGESKP